MKKLLLFDIDCTLITSKNRIGHKVTYEAFEELLGIPIPLDHPATFAGKTDLQIFHELAAEFGADPARVAEQKGNLREVLGRRFADYGTPEWFELLPGAGALVRALDADEDAVLGLVTGNVRPSAYTKLRSHSLDGFFAFGAFGCDEADRAKLPPLALERAEEWSGTRFSLEDTVIIGDAPGDVYCAKVHGIRVVAVATGGTTAEELRAVGADVVFDDFSRTDDVCAAMLGR